MNEFYKLVRSLFFIVSLIIGGQSLSLADDFTKGEEAYKKGDFITALKFWQPLAENGNVGAQYKLGQMYRLGEGLPQDNKTAVKWYTLAAEQGNAEAAFNLGVIYRSGEEGVPLDDKTAVKWYMIAAEQGHAVSQLGLGVMYAEGLGVPQNDIKAYMWLNISVANGNRYGIERRDLARKQLTSAQIEKAQEYSSKCIKQNYKNCDF